MSIASENTGSSTASVMESEGRYRQAIGGVKDTLMGFTGEFGVMDRDQLSELVFDVAPLLAYMNWAGKPKTQPKKN
jgi:hypothetical protein